MRKRVDHLSAMLKSATMNADGVAAAAAAAKPEGGMPLPKLSKPEEKPDNSADIMKMQHELAGKDKEIAKLNSKMQEIKFDMERTRMQSEFNEARSKMMSQIQAEHNKLKADIASKQKELDAKQRKFKDEEAKHKANLTMAEAQHRANLHQELADHKVQIAEQKSQSLMDLANMQTDQYIKMTDKARKDADNYWADKDKKFKASHPGIHPILQQRLDQLGTTTSRLAKLRFNKLASMGETEVKKNSTLSPSSSGTGASVPSTSSVKPPVQPTNTPAQRAAKATPAVPTRQDINPYQNASAPPQRQPGPYADKATTYERSKTKNGVTTLDRFQHMRRQADQEHMRMKSMGLTGETSVTQVERQLASIRGQIKEMRERGQQVPPELLKNERYLAGYSRQQIENLQGRINSGVFSEQDRVDWGSHVLQNERKYNSGWLARSLDWISGNGDTNIYASDLERIQNANEYARIEGSKNWFGRNKDWVIGGAGLAASLAATALTGGAAAPSIAAAGAFLSAVAGAHMAEEAGRNWYHSAHAANTLGVNRGFTDVDNSQGSELARNAYKTYAAEHGYKRSWGGDLLGTGLGVTYAIPAVGQATKAIGAGTNIAKVTNNLSSMTGMVGKGVNAVTGNALSRGYNAATAAIANRLGGGVGTQAFNTAAGFAPGVLTMGGDMGIYMGSELHTANAAADQLQRYPDPYEGQAWVNAQYQMYPNYNYTQVNTNYDPLYKRSSAKRSIDVAIQNFVKSAERRVTAQEYNDGAAFHMDPHYDRMLEKGPLSRERYRKFVAPLLGKITGRAFTRDYEWRNNTNHRWFDYSAVPHNAAATLQPQYEYHTPYGNAVARQAMNQWRGNTVMA